MKVWKGFCDGVNFVDGDRCLEKKKSIGASLDVDIYPFFIDIRRVDFDEGKWQRWACHPRDARHISGNHSVLIEFRI